MEVKMAGRVEGRVVVGPRQVNGGFARIVAHKDGSGRLESYNPKSGTWLPAPESMTFSEIWSAPPVSAALRASLGSRS